MPASISYITTASVLRATAAVKQPSLNIGGVVAYTTAFAARSATYTSLDAVAAVFATTTSIYKAAAAFFAQNPAPEKFKVLRCALPSTKVFLITPTAANSKAYKIKINGTEVTYTSDASATAQEIVEGLKTAIDALAVSGLTVTEDNVVLTLTGTAGTWFSVELSGTTDDGVMTIAETTTDPGIATDLAAIQAADKEWYAFGLVDNSDAIVNAAAAWAESNGKAFYEITQDSDVPTSATTDTMSDQKTATRDRSNCGWHHNPREFPQFALMAVMLARTPGKRAAFHKQLNGISASVLNDTQIGHILAKNGWYYTEFGGLNRTDGGKVGSGEWLDIIFGADYYDARLETEAASLALREPDKIDFDNTGIAKYENVLRQIHAEMLANNFVRLDFETWPEFGYKITVPDEDDISTTDFVARELKNMELETKIKGAIKKTSFTMRLVA